MVDINNLVHHGTVICTAPEPEPGNNNTETDTDTDTDIESQGHMPVCSSIISSEP